MYPTNRRVNSVLKSTECSMCHEPKNPNEFFCTYCMDKLPPDLQHDLKEKDERTQMLAYTDASLFLSNDWR
jgi:hypothetical protein